MLKNSANIINTLLFVLLALLSYIPSIQASDPNYISPEKVAGAETINSQKAKQLFDKGAFFIDVRKDSDFEAGRIPGALHLEYSDVDPNKRLLSSKTLEENKVSKDSDIVFYCNGIHCARSSIAAKLSLEWGYKKVYYYRLGFPDWRLNGFPFE